MKYGDVVVQKTQTEIQVEGIFDNWRWVVLKAQYKDKEYLECFGFDGKSHCSIPFIKESEYEIVGNIAAILERERVKAELARFSYVDWETGDDDVLRLGDYINSNRQDHNGIDVESFDGRIVKHHDNDMPVIVYNADKDDEGEYASIQDLYISGFEFTRLAQLKKGKA